MSTTTQNHDTTRDRVITRDRVSETRPASKTTEFMAYLATVFAIIVTAFLVGDDGDNTADPFSAEHAMRYITFLTIGYMVARGLAKAGTRAHNRDDA